MWVADEGMRVAWTSLGYSTDPREHQDLSRGMGACESI